MRILYYTFLFVLYSCSNYKEDEWVLYPSKKIRLGMRFNKVNEIFNHKLEPFDNPENNDLSYYLVVDTLFNKEILGQSSLVFKDGRLFSIKCVFYGDEFAPLDEFYMTKFNDSSSLKNNMVVYANKEKPFLGKFYKPAGKTPERLIGTYLISSAKDRDR